ncbi:hypothetical protein A2U01_0054760, partial [Trifolium medium]|nr:hypothetical protein [Trifolium medium]
MLAELLVELIKVVLKGQVGVELVLN